MLKCQSNLHNIKVVSSNPAHGEVYSIQHYVIKFVSDRSEVFSGYSGSPPNKTDRHDITEIFLKVALNTINLNLSNLFQSVSIENQHDEIPILY